MRVLNNNIIIKVEEVKKSSIIVTDMPEEITGYAKVVVVGKEVSEVNEGDRIFYNKNSGRFISLDGEEYLMITENDVFIIFGKENKWK